MGHTPITAPDAPQPIGPYAVAHLDEESGLLFCSGQTPIDPTTGHLVSGDMGEQARQVFDNLRHVLAAAGATMADVLKTKVTHTETHLPM